MITQPIMNRIVKAVERQTGVYPLAKNRRREVVRSRQIVVMIAIDLFYKHKGLKAKVPGITDIGKLIDFNHATVYNCYIHGSEHYEMEKDFRLDYDIALRRFKVLEQNVKHQPCRLTRYSFARVINDNRTKALLVGIRV